MKYNKDTSEKILNSAKTVFGEKGFSGARMQEIADNARINKALLHYYYKSKDKLFEIILQRAIQLLIPRVIEVIKSDDTFFEKIENFVALYIDLLMKHPHIPEFVMHEINSNPKRLLKFIDASGIDVSFLKKEINQEIKNETIIDLAPEQLIVNIISLCIFPFVAKPIIISLVLEKDEKEYKHFIEQRKTEVSKFIINAIKR